MNAYRHGGDIVAFAKRAGCRIDEVIDLSSNINFVTPRVNLDLDHIDLAPYPNYDELYAALAQHYGVAIEEMELFNGASAAIFALFAHFQDRLTHCCIYAPAYVEYKKAARLFSYETVQIDRFSAPDTLPPKGALVIFVNPSTPDGKYYAIDTLFEIWRERACTVVIDESFIEFTDTPSASTKLATYPKLYILKSLTKYWGAAGVRIGALLSNIANITALRYREPLWKISAFDMHYILAALNDKDFPEKSKVQNAANKALLLSILKRSPLIDTIHPSNANFVLVKLKGIDAPSLQAKLQPYRILIRDCSNFDGLDQTYIRLAVKEKNKIQHLLKALQKII